MEQLDYIKKVLNIKDQNITITAVETQTTHIDILATLDYHPPLCPHCNNKMIRYDFQKPSRVPLLESGGMKTLMWLKKRRFQCKECRKVVVSEAHLVKKNHQISNPVKLKIIEKLKNNETLTEIARQLGVSPTTVYRQLNKIQTPTNFRTLPKHLSWDEFAFMKGSMSFIVQDFSTNRIISILETRRIQDVEIFFMQFKAKARRRVKTISMDMYDPYIQLAKRLFPNAKIVLDRFHIVQHFSRAFLKTRLKIQNRYPKKSLTYRALKKYWRLLQKNQEGISLEPHYQRTFKKHLSSLDVVNLIKDLEPEIARYYELYQMLLDHFNHRNFNDFFALIKANKKTVNPYFKTVFKTFLKYKKHIKNAFELPYHNGKIEATNNVIKVIKRKAYGYRNFDNFKKRIYCATNLKVISRPIILSRIQKSSYSN